MLLQRQIKNVVVVQGFPFCGFIELFEQGCLETTVVAFQNSLERHMQLSVSTRRHFQRYYGFTFVFGCLGKHMNRKIMPNMLRSRATFD